MAKMIGVSPRTVVYRMAEYGLSIRATYTDLTDQELSELIRGIEEVESKGYRTVRAELEAKGIRVQEYRVRRLMRDLNPCGVLMRRLFLRTVNRRQYSVRAPLSLWHIDGNHKLIRQVFR